MPRATDTKPDPSAVYICWMSGSAEVDGQTVSFHEGQRLRGDSPAVQGCPQYFVLDGAPEGERPNAFEAIVKRADAEQAAPEHEIQLAGPLPVPLEVEDVIQLTRAVTVRAGYVEEQKIATFDKGTVFAVRSEVAGLLPDDSYEHAAVQFVKPKARRR